MRNRNKAVAVAVAVAMPWIFSEDKLRGRENRHKDRKAELILGICTEYREEQMKSEEMGMEQKKSRASDE